MFREWLHHRTAHVHMYTSVLEGGRKEGERERESERDQGVGGEGVSLFTPRPLMMCVGSVGSLGCTCTV